MSNIICSPLLTKFSKALNSKILLFRHGESFYNKTIRDFQKLKVKNPAEYKTKITETRFNPSLSDCNLTENGEFQSYDAGKKLEGLNIKYIFTSPLLRALQSCESIIKGYLDVHKVIDKTTGKTIKAIKAPKVIVNPLLFEKIQVTCDIIPNIYKNMEAFPEYDWNDFKALKQETLPIYMLNYCDTIIDIKTKKVKFSTDNPYFNLSLKYFKQNLKFNHQGIVLQAMEELHQENVFIESSVKTYDRLVEFKTNLKNFLNQNELKNDEKILIVGHSVLFKLLSTQNLYEDTLDPVLDEVNYIHLSNGELASLFFDDENLFKNLKI